MSSTAETATRQTLRPSRHDLTVLGHTVAIAVSGIAMTYGVGLATQANLLIPLAAPLGIGLVLAMSWIPYRTQIIGWAVLTVWLLSTVYLGLDALEPVALVVIVLLSLAGGSRPPGFSWPSGRCIRSGISRCRGSFPPRRPTCLWAA